MAEQISVSRDTLRAELSDLELRLVDRITLLQSLNASKSDVYKLVDRISVLERWRYAWPSTAVIGIVVAALAVVFH